MTDLVSHIPRFAGLEAVALQFTGDSRLELPALEGVEPFDQATIEISFLLTRIVPRVVLLAPAGGEADGQPRIELITRDDGTGAVLFGVDGFAQAELPLAAGGRFEPGLWDQLALYYDRGGDDTKAFARAIVNNVMTEKQEWKKGAPPLVFPALRIGDFEGAVNDLRVWRGVLGPEVVLAAGRTVFRRPATFGEATIAATWPMVEGFGDTVFDYAGDRHARLTGGRDRPAWVVSSDDVTPIYIIDVLENENQAESLVSLQHPEGEQATRLTI